MTIRLLPIKQLKPHEQISPGRNRRLLKRLLRDKRLLRPVIIDKKTKVILDGHHRCYLLSGLGYNKIPVLLVNYQSPQITLSPRRKNFVVSKQQVLWRARNKKLYPYRTTRHLMPQKLPLINVKFSQLN